MDRRTFVKNVSAAGIAAGATPTYMLRTQNPQVMEPIILPEPEKHVGLSVLEALQLRHTDRNISPRELLPLQTLSNLLRAGQPPRQAMHMTLIRY
jgi:hypothetical protein